MIPEVIIVVKGGVVQAAYSNVDKAWPHGVNVDVLDYDNMEQETDPDTLGYMKELEGALPTLKAVL